MFEVTEFQEQSIEPWVLIPLTNCTLRDQNLNRLRTNGSKSERTKEKNIKRLDFQRMGSPVYGFTVHKNSIVCPTRSRYYDPQNHDNNYLNQHVYHYVFILFMKRCCQLPLKYAKKGFPVEVSVHAIPKRYRLCFYVFNWINFLFISIRFLIQVFNRFGLF